MKKRSYGYQLLSLLLIAASAAACSSAAATSTPSATAPAANPVSGVVVSTAATEMVSYEKDDQDYSNWKEGNPTTIELGGTAATINGPGAALNGNKIMILSAGVFVISGKLTGGQIIVDSQTKGTVQLVLNGAELNSADSAALYVQNAAKTIITLQDGTKNLIADAKTYVATGEDAPNAAIFSKDDLTINGKGTLTVRGNYKDGITSKDDLKITGGTIVVQAVDDGLTGRDVVAVKDGTITVTAGGDGIKATNDTDPAKGNIALEGGAFEIKSGADGIQAETSVLISGGTYTITTKGGSVNSSKSTAATQNPFAGRATPQTQTQTATDTGSAKGIKAGVEIAISGGTFKIDSAEDAIHSNKTVTIAGGDSSIASGNAGIHGDEAIQIQGGKIDITKSYEGIESKLVTVSGGETRLVSSDDGINLVDGSSASATPGRQGQATAGKAALHINGGYLAVDAMGDGVDANGSIYMTDGTLVVSGPTANDNGPLDYDGVFEMTGGFLAAAGSSGMAQAPSDQSSQYSVIMNFSKVQAAGTLFTVKDSKENVVASFAPKRQYQSVVVSSPLLTKGGSYTVYTGGTSTGSLSDGLQKDAKGGTKIVGFSISSITTWLSETGVTTPGAGRRPFR